MAPILVGVAAGLSGQSHAMAVSYLMQHVDLDWKRPYEGGHASPAVV